MKSNRFLKLVFQGPMWPFDLCHWAMLSSGRCFCTLTSEYPKVQQNTATAACSEVLHGDLKSLNLLLMCAVQTAEDFVLGKVGMS